ncbi:unnamed protein product [Symbiodinium natans]|uniref:Nudix hydrolase domain-containing protein n=1 Tax=Symbiodinium natans TaxID=878477 RepID=A0A812PAX8_9DINO|nr:unnamed protein product [Symbiodinium natans]
MARLALDSVPGLDRNPVHEPTCYRCGYPWLGHVESLGPYNKWCLRRWAAGIIVTFTDPVTLDPFILFGKERRVDGGYNVFWGFGELHEQDPRQTAARETCEEALGILGSEQEILASIAGQASADAEVPLFLLDIGAQQIASLAEMYHERRQLWTSAAQSLKPLAQAKMQPGGDVMDALFAVPAQEFLAACHQMQGWRGGKGGRASVSLHALNGGSVCLPKVEGMRVSKKGATSSGGLRPRPPAVHVASLLARPRTETAFKLRSFCLQGRGDHLLPQHTLNAAPIPGVSWDGVADGSMLAAQAIFSATWTGPHGSSSAFTVESLADACAKYLSSFSEANVKLYLTAWMLRATDSPQQAKLAARHIVRLARCLPVISLVNEQAAIMLGRARQRVDASLAAIGHEKSDHESLTSCYQFLAGACFVNELVKVGCCGTMPAMRTTDVDQARQHLESAWAQFKPAWLPPAAEEAAKEVARDIASNRIKKADGG